MTTNMILALVVFIISYIFIVTEWVNKMIAAMLGGFLLIFLGVAKENVIIGNIDWNVIFLLLGMMIVVAVLKQTGVFQYIAIKCAKLARGNPTIIMILLFLVTAFVSAFLDNVTTVMMLVPVTILIASELDISPIPFVINLAVASNLGGTATLIGDPPNIMIGSATGFSFLDFMINLTPVIAINVLVMIPIIYLLFHKKLVVSTERKARVMEFDEKGMITNSSLLKKSMVVVALMLLAFFTQELTGLNSGTIAFSTGLILMILSNRKEVEHILTKDMDWVTIFFFIGLFMIVGALQSTGVLKIASDWIIKITHDNLAATTFSLIWFSGFLSSIVDNVPFVATMIPLIKGLAVHLPPAHTEVLWWSLSLGACLGGNGTMIGASANIVSVSLANRSGHHISFWDFTKYGFLYMLLSLVLASLYIWLRYFI